MVILSDSDSDTGGDNDDSHPRSPAASTVSAGARDDEIPDVWDGFDENCAIFDQFTSPLQVGAVGCPVSNAAVSEAQSTVAGLSTDSYTSSPVHCSPLSTAKPPSPVFSTSLVATSNWDTNHHHSPSSPTQHSPVSTERRPQSVLFSPPTDMDTDVSAIIGHAADDSQMWKSDISFEVRSNTWPLFFRIYAAVFVSASNAMLSLRMLYFFSFVSVLFLSLFVVFYVWQLLSFFLPSFLCYRNVCWLLSENKHDRLETLTECADWSVCG